MKKTKNLLTLILVIAMLTGTISAWAFCDVQTDLPVSIEASEIPENLSFLPGTFEVSLTGGAATAAEFSCSSLTEAAEFLREQMEDRVTEVTIAVQDYSYVSNEQLSEEWRTILFGAFEHTGVPTQGDYIMRHYGSSKGSIGYDGDSTAIFRYTITYDTTLEQESIVGEQIDELFDEWDLRWGFHSLPAYERVEMIYDYICDNVAYDYENYGDDSYMLKHSAYGALINGAATSQGYANLFYRMALTAGIDARIIAGYAGGGYEAWNIVKLGNRYYCLDATWDAGRNGDYRWFLLGSNAFHYDHTPDEEFGSAAFLRDYPISAANYIVPVIALDRTELTIEVGDTDLLTATVLPGYGCSEAVYWISSDTNVVIVDDGFVTAVSIGEARVTAWTSNFVYSVSCDVTVIPAEQETSDIYLAQVTDVCDPVYDKAGHMVRDALAEFMIFGAQSSVVVGGSEFVEGSYWLVQYNEDTGAVTPIAQPATIIGRQTVLWWNAAKHTIDGVTYENSVNYALDSAGYDKDNEYVWFFDLDNRVIGSAEVVKTYAVVLGAQWINSVSEGGYAMGVVYYLNGETVTQRISTINGITAHYAGYDEADFAAGAISTTYQYNSNTEAHLYEVVETDDGLELTAVLTDLDTQIRDDVPQLAPGYYGDNNTIYFFYNAETDSVDIVAGFDNLPASYDCWGVDVIENTNGFARYVYIPSWQQIGEPHVIVYKPIYMTDCTYWYQSGEYFVVCGTVSADGSSAPLKFSTTAFGSADATEFALDYMISQFAGMVFLVAEDASDGIVLEMVPVAMDDWTMLGGAPALGLYRYILYANGEDVEFGDGVLCIGGETVLTTNNETLVVDNDGSCSLLAPEELGDTNMYIVHFNGVVEAIFLTDVEAYREENGSLMSKADEMVCSLNAGAMSDAISSFTYDIGDDTSVMRLTDAIRNSVVITMIDSLFVYDTILIETAVIGEQNGYAVVEVRISSDRAIVVFDILVPMTASGTCGENLTWTFENGVLTIAGEGEMDDWNVWGYSYAPWFDFRSEITEVVIGEGVTSIGSYAFSGCTSLATITIPESVTSIGYYAFYQCSALTTVHYGGNREQWGDLRESEGNEILSCVELIVYSPDTCGENLFWTLENGVLTITGTGRMDDWYVWDYSYAPWFDFWSEITEVVIGEGVTTIGEGAFSCCGSLVNIVIPDSVTTIGASAFWNCTSLVSVEIPDSVRTLGAGVFQDCYSLTDIVIPDSVRTISDFMFYNCTGLMNVEIPDSVTYIGDYAFAECTGLVSVALSNGLTSIGDYVFSNCTSLADVAIPESVTSIGYRAFYKCSALTTVHYGGNRTQWSEISIGSGNECLHSARILYTAPDAGTCGINLVWTMDMDGVLTITGTGRMDDWGDWWFAGGAPWHLFSDEILRVVIGEGVKTIGNGAFVGCVNLTDVEISGSVRTIGKNAFQSCASLTSIEIPDSVTTIGEGAFSCCGSLVNIVIPDSVTTIGASAFSGCTSLVSVEIPDSVRTLGAGVFQDCYSLTDIVIPDSVRTISDFMFYNCTGLMNVELPDSVTSIGYYAFSECWSLERIEIPDSVTTIGEGAFSYCGSLVNIVIPDSVTTIGASAFSGCTSLVSVALSNGLTSIGDYVFYNCTSLADVAIPESVTSIGVYAFGNCMGLVSVTIPEGVRNIEVYAFENCYSLESITIPGSVENLGAYAFHNCVSLAGATIHGNMMRIGDAAFQDCTGLVEVVIGDGVTEIGSAVFYGCTALETVTFGNDLLVIGTEAFVDCTALRYLELPDSLVEIGESAFYDCTGLVSADLGDVRVIGMHAFRNCGSLTELALTANLTSVGRYAFRGCSALARVDYAGNWEQWEALQANIGSKNDELLNAEILCFLASGTCGDALVWELARNGVLTIRGEGTMENNGDAPWVDYAAEIRCVVIGGGVTGFCRQYFLDCCYLTDILVDGENPIYCDLDGVLFSKDLAQLICVPAGKHQTEYAIPDGVSTIESYALSGCTELAAITIPESVTSVGDNAFADCDALEVIYYGGTAEQWRTMEIGNGNECLMNTVVVLGLGVCGDDLSWILTVDGVLTISGEGEIYSYGNAEETPWDDHAAEIIFVVIENGVTGIGDNAFADCSGLLYIAIPESVAYIGDHAFLNCAVLEEVYYHGTATQWRELPVGENNDVLQEAEVILAIGVCGDSLGWKFNVDGTLTIYGDGDMTEFSQSDLPPWIGYSDEITTVVIEDGVTSIGAYAFYNCSKLAAVSIPASAVEIGEYAFFGCSALEIISLPDGLKKIREGVFAESGLVIVSLPDSVVSIGDYAFAGCRKLSAVSIPKSVAEIGEKALYQCRSLRSLTIPNSVTSIGSYAFAECAKLGSVTLPNELTFIPEHLFESCTSLRRVVIPASVAEIGEYAFSDCVALTEITMENGLQTIGNFAFLNCSSVTELVLPDSVKTIGTGAFAVCSELMEVFLGVGLESVADMAFAECGALETVSYAGGAHQWTKIKFGIENGCLLDADIIFVADLMLVENAELAGIMKYLGEIDLDAKLTRLDAVKILVALTGVIPEEDAEYPFQDGGNLTAEEKSLIAAAVLHKLMNGVDANSFYADGPVTRMELAVLLYRVMTGDVTGAHAALYCDAVIGVYDDVTVNLWYSGYLGYCLNSKIIADGEDTFRGAEQADFRTVLRWMINAAERQPAVPAPVLTVELDGNDMPRLTWTGNDRAQEYAVAYSVDGKNFSRLTTTDTCMTHSDAERGVTYYYKVMVVGAGGNSGYSAVVSIEVPVSIAAPVVTGSANADTGIPKLTWDAVDGAEKYEIWRATSKNGTYYKQYTTTRTYYNNTSAKAGKTYYYKVRAIVGDKTGEFSAVVSVTCVCARPTVTIKNNPDSGKPTLTWDAVTGAEKYEIWRSTSKTGTYTKMYTTTGTKYTNTGAVAGTTYYYQVRAVAGTTYSEFSTVKSICCDCARPVVTGSINDSGYPKLTWDAVAGAEKYEIWRATSENGEYTKLYTTTRTYYNNTSAEAGKTYYYKVKAICGKSSYGNSAFSDVVSLTCVCAAPTVTGIVNDNGYPKLTWKAVKGAVKYEIWRSTSKNGTYYKQYTTTRTYYNNTSAQAGKTYYYKVKAICGESSDGNSTFSSVTSVTCICATPSVSGKVNTNGDPRLTWDAVKGAEKYEIWRSTSKDGVYTKMYTTTRTYYNNTNAEAGKTYYYKVVAICGESSCGNSAYSNIVAVTAE